MASRKAKNQVEEPAAELTITDESGAVTTVTAEIAEDETGTEKLVIEDVDGNVTEITVESEAPAAERLTVVLAPNCRWGMVQVAGLLFTRHPREVVVDEAAAAELRANPYLRVE